jgi:alkaline phosphatase D
VDPVEISRREFLAGSAALACSFGAPFPMLSASQKFSRYPFTLGVASGDPLPDSIVLWTRLAPDPLNGGGLEQQTVPVDWSVASDEMMKHIVRRGTAQANPVLGHSIHVEARGLEPSRWYWYQFRAGSELSPIGRTRTAPAPADSRKSLSFVFASCQHYEHGYFTAFRHLADEDLELVVHLGDYIYESPPQDGKIRRHGGPEPTTVTGYRNRYALYKSDPELQLAHASFPWLVTWDDHEVDNNYAGSISVDNAPVRSFLRRRAAAYQAFYEHMPLSETGLAGRMHLVNVR